MNKDITDLKSRERVKELDAAAGASLRRLRLAKGMSQTVLGEAVGLTFQQIQKYEKGSNRISISRLCQFSEILDFSPVQFFENLDSMTSREPDAVARLMTMMSSPQISSVVENLSNIGDDVLVAKISALIETVAGERSSKRKDYSPAPRPARKLAS
jgi:transcriptional regulator with XRE-family HTH domain